MEIREADFDDPQVRALLRLHLAGMHDNSPPGTDHALDLDGLRQPTIRLYAAWDGDGLLGFGALKALDADVGEIKSMRTHPDAVRRGVARALLEHIIAQARARGYRRLSLETGTGPAFDAAQALYERYGFVQGAVFAGYWETDFNRFFHLDL